MLVIRPAEASNDADHRPRVVRRNQRSWREVHASADRSARRNSAGDILRHAFRPALVMLKAPTRVELLYWPKLPFQGQSHLVGFPHPAQLSEIIRDEMDGFLIVIRDYRRCPIGPTHHQLHAIRKVNSMHQGWIVPGKLGRATWPHDDGCQAR
jgi:hypothetical protein